MAISDNILDRDKRAYKENTSDGGLDRRVTDTSSQIKLDTANSLLTTIRDNADTLEVKIGELTETVPGTDTASSGLNGRLQRLAQRLTSLITATTDRTQKTQITNGTNDAAVGNSTPSLSDYGLVVRTLPYEPIRYTAASDGFAIAATATDIFEIKGSETKTVRVKKITVSGRTTSGSPVACIIKVLKRSTANTAGTAVTTTMVPLDSTSAVATAAVKHYTANPTLGTLVGNIRTNSITFQSAGLLQIIEMTFETPLILRGTSEILAINFNSTSVTGSSICCYVEWDEV